MLGTYCYYFITSGLMASAIVGLYYYFDPNGAKQLATIISWKGVNLYVCTKTYLEQFVENDEEETNEKDTIKSDDEPMFLFYDNNQNTFLCSTKLTDDIKKTIENDKINVKFLRRIVGSKLEYRRLNDEFESENIEFDPVEKQFIQIELIQNNKITDIHHNLIEHYFVGNKILDKDFIKWYTQFYGYDELSDNYTLKIIDKDVKMFNIGSDDYILITKEGYEVKNNNN